VVVGTYNHEAFIGEALTSILRQEYQLGAVEVLVIDHGSRDGTGKELWTEPAENPIKKTPQVVLPMGSTS
jgi:GT2 family glycosyltransferase